jgi:hypothetical protein
MTRIPIDPRQVHPKEIYEFEWMMNFVVVGQLTFSYRTFQLIEVIKNLDKLKTFIEIGNTISIEQRVEYLKDNDFLFQRILDDIKIAMVFENYFKSKLLLNDYIIHVINPTNDKLKKLKNLQFKRPIEKSELLKIVGDVNEIKNNITENTINYSTILNSPKYYKLFLIEREIIDFLIQLNKERNRLHLLYSEPIIISRKEYNYFIKLSEIVKYDITILQRTLIDKMDPESKSKIPIKF